MSAPNKPNNCNLEVLEAFVTKHDQQHENGIRSRIRELASQYKKAKIELAKLLIEARQNGFWRGEFSSFRQYVEEEVGIPIRVAQELMRVYQKCSEAKISDAEMSEAGWSKLALVANHLTQENAAQQLKLAKESSYRDLKAKQAETARKTKASTKRESPIVVSYVVEQAIQLACRHTGDSEITTNLDFIAKTFIDLCPPPSYIDPKPSSN